MLRQITIIGKAARAVSETTKAQSPEIPRHKMAGMRNRLVHDYRDTDFEEVWETATRDIPQLKRQIEALLNNL